MNDAKATPPTIGTREESTQKWALCAHKEVKTKLLFSKFKLFTEMEGLSC